MTTAVAAVTAADGRGRGRGRGRCRGRVNGRGRCAEVIFGNKEMLFRQECQLFDSDILTFSGHGQAIPGTQNCLENVQ